MLGVATDASSVVVAAEVGPDEEFGFGFEFLLAGVLDDSLVLLVELDA